jgi:hypothetical protein
MIEVAHGMRIMQKHYRGLRTVNVLPSLPAGTGDHCPQISQRLGLKFSVRKASMAARKAHRLHMNQIAKMSLGN